MNIRLPLRLSRKRNQINLHLLEEDWKSAIAKIVCHPHDCQIWSSRAGFFGGDDESRVLPIHVACSLRAPLEVVRAIVDAYPGCLTARDSSFKRLPIHVACMFAAPEDVIEYLTREHVEGTLAEDVMGRLPIHYACSNGSPEAVVEMFLSVNPASILHADFNGWLPLHVAVHFGASTEVVREIVRACPAAVEIETRKSSTALSLAEKLGTNNRDEVIAVLRGAMGTGQSDTKQSYFVRRVPVAV